MRLILSLFLAWVSATAVSSFVVPHHQKSPSFIKRSSPKTEPSFVGRSKVRAELAPVPLHDLGILISQETIEASTNLIQTYETLLRDNPVTTKSITSAVLACIGDAIAQFRSKQEDQEFEYDINRGIAFLGFGALYTGAFQHIWFQFLSDHISQWGEVLRVWGPTRVSIPVDTLYDAKEWWSYFDIVTGMENPPSDAAVAAGKLAVNQFLMVPTLYMPLFFSLTGVLANLDLNQSLARAQSLYLPLLKRNYFFWLPMQFFQFLVVPTQWQIPFMSVASLVWTVIISSIGSASAPPVTSPQSIVAYESTAEDEVQVYQVHAGAVNGVTDDVSLEDVENAFIPQAVQDALSNPQVGVATATGTMALLAAAADEGILGGVVANMVGSEIGAGVAAATAIGAGVGLLASSQVKSAVNEDDDDVTELENLGLQMSTNVNSEFALLGPRPSRLNTTNTSTTLDIYQDVER